MGPIQLWLPIVECSSTETAAHKERAFAAWRRESCVWLLPWVENLIRWQEGRGWWSWQVAVPAVDLNRIDIFYIEDGQVGGPGASKRFPDGCGEDLWKAWLNLKWPSIVDGSGTAPQPLTLRSPKFKGPDVTYSEELFGQRGPSASDLAAYIEVFPAIWEEGPDRSSYSSDSTGRTQKDAEDEVPQSLQVILRCPQWLTALPHSEAFFEDVIAAREQMTTIVRKCRKNPIGALREAQEAAIPYIAEGLITRGEAWLWRTGPSLWKRAKGDDSIVSKLLLEDAQEKFGIKARQLEEALQSGEWPGTMNQLTSIRRAWGMVGLFWALFLEQFESHQICSRCHKIIKGNRGKENCGPSDDIECYRRRRAKDKRISRAARKQEQQDL